MEYKVISRQQQTVKIDDVSVTRTLEEMEYILQDSLDSVIDETIDLLMVNRNVDPMDISVSYSTPVEIEGLLVQEATLTW